MLDTENNQALELKKHINAIHCSNHFSLVQRKLFNALLYNAYPELPHKSQFEIPAKTLCHLIGYNSNDYGKLKNALLALISIAIEWNVVDYSLPGTTDKWRASSALSSAKLEDGVCTYEYSTLMRELLYHPEIYGRLNMTALSQFNSSYGIALYENCVRYQGLPQTPWFTLDVFRKLMGVFGDKYIIFKDFKKRVLNIAIDEVNKLTSITLLPEIKRSNQKVVGIRFKLIAKNHGFDNKLSENEHHDELINRLANDFNFSPETIKQVLSKYDTTYLRDKMNIIINSESFQAGKVRGVAGYLMDALKNDYKASKSSKIISEAKRRNKEKVEEISRNKQRKEEEQVQRYNQYICNIIDTYLALLPDDRRQNLIQAFEQSLNENPTIISRWYRKHGLVHAGVKALFNKFIRNTQTQHIGVIISFDEFLMKHCEYKGETFAG